MLDNAISCGFARMGGTVCRYDGGWFESGSIDKSGLSKTIMRDAPKDIRLKRAEGLLEVTWSDEESQRFRVRQLRCACACAGCVDEMTGIRTLDVNAVPDDISITNMQLVGNYAVKFVFSDGHDTGIYAWDRLYEMQNVT